MADVRVASTGDALPLLDPDGSSNYVVGRNNASDVRGGLFALLGSSAAGSALSVRPGVYARSWFSGTAFDLRVVQAVSASRFVQITPGITMHTRSGINGGWAAFWPSTVSIQASAANVTNPRIDLVVARLYDKGVFVGDAFHGPYIEIIEGIAGAIPAVPATPDGAVVLAELARDAGAPGDTITDAKITDRRKGASLPGTPRLLLAGDSAGDAGVVPGELRHRVVSNVLRPLEYWGTDGVWHGLAPIAHQPVRGATATGGSNTGSPTAISFAVPDPGWPYYLEASGALTWDQGINTVYYPEIRTASGTVIARGASVGTNQSQPTGTNRTGQVPINRSATSLTGAQTVNLVLARDAASTDGASGVVVYNTPLFNYLHVRVIPA